MKKFLKTLVFLVLFALLIQYLVILFTKKHEVNYVIKNNKYEFNINEKYQKTNDKDIYIFKVSTNKKEYVFSYDYDYNKQDKIITDIKYYKKDNVQCIFPIFKDDRVSDIYCNYKDKQVSYSYLKQINNEEINEFEEKISKKYKVDTFNKSDIATKVDSVIFYKDNIKDNLVFTMWNYRGFVIASKDEIINKKLLKNDHYENNISYLIDNYYVFMNTDKETTINYPSFYVYNLKKNNVKKYKFPNGVSKSFYYNGDYDKKIYYTDLSSKKQYALNPKSGKIKEVGNKTNGFYNVVDNELVKVENKDYFNDNKIFNSKVEVSEIKSKNVVDIKKDSNNYYYKTKDGSIYKVYGNNYKNPVLLFNFSSISEWKVKDGKMIIVSDKYLYYYDDQYGLLEILENNELIYNYKNICDFVEL